MITKISDFKINESLSGDRAREAKLQILIDTARQMIENYKKAEEFEQLKNEKNIEVKEVLERLNKTSVIAEGVLIEVIKPFQQKRFSSKAYFDFIETSVGTISEDFRLLSNEIKATSIKMAAEKEYLRLNKNTRNKETGTMSEGIGDFYNNIKNWVKAFVSKLSVLLNKTERDLDIIMTKAKKFSSMVESASTFTNTNSDYETSVVLEQIEWSEIHGQVHAMLENYNEELYYNTDGISTSNFANLTNDIVNYIKSLNVNENVNEKLSQDEKEHIISLYNNGISQSDIADQYGYNFNDVLKVTKYLGHGSWFNDEEEERLGDDPMSKQYYDRTLENLSPEEERRLRRNRASRDSHARRREQNKNVENVLVKAKEAIKLAQKQSYFEELAKVQEEQVIALLKEFNSKSIAIDDVILNLIRTESKPVLDTAEYEKNMTNAEQVGDAVALMSKALIEIHKNTVNISGSVRQYKDDSNSPDGTFNARFDWENKTVIPPTANEGIGDYVKSAWNSIKRFFLRFKMASKRFDTALENIVQIQNLNENENKLRLSFRKLKGSLYETIIDPDYYMEDSTEYKVVSEMMPNKDNLIYAHTTNAENYSWVIVYDPISKNAYYDGMLFDKDGKSVNYTESYFTHSNVSNTDEAVSILKSKDPTIYV